MWGSVVGLLVNAVLNAILIFGLFNMPALGVSGAAIATLIARIVECFIILLIVTLKVKPLRLTLKDFKHIDAPMAKLLYVTALPGRVKRVMLGTSECHLYDDLWSIL